MEVEVLLFAALRERAGTGRVVLPVPEGTTVAGLVEQLRALHPSLPPIGPACRVALNESFERAETLLRAGDVVALLPPVSGG